MIKLTFGLKIDFENLDGLFTFQSSQTRAILKVKIFTVVIQRASWWWQRQPKFFYLGPEIIFKTVVNWINSHCMLLWFTSSLCVASLHRTSPKPSKTNFRKMDSAFSPSLLALFFFWLCNYIPFHDKTVKAWKFQSLPSLYHQLSQKSIVNLNFSIFKHTHRRKSIRPFCWL